MPCYDPDTHLEPERLKAKVNALTDMLCRLYEYVPNVRALPEDIRAWYEEHQKQDAARKNK